MSYSLAFYGQMIADRVRLEAYAAALARHVTPTSVVVDLGCGTGIFSLLACRLGARRVYAIEPDAAVHVARQLAQANGYGARIVCFQARAEAVELPEPADLVVGDLRGALPFHPGNFTAFAHARRHFLRPGGVVIPRRDRLYVALVRAPAIHARHLRPWGRGAAGFDFAAASARLAHTWGTPSFRAAHLVTPAQPWLELDYAGDLPRHADRTLAWTSDQPLTCHGACLWFDAELTAGIGFSGSPAAARRPTVYGSAYFPSTKPLRLAAGETVSLRLTVDVGEPQFLFRWEWAVRTAAGTIRHTAAHSTLAAAPLAAAQLARRAPECRGTLNEDGRIDLAVLGRLAAGVALGDIARELARAFPDRFPGWQQAMGRVGALAEVYGTPAPAAPQPQS